MSFIAKPKVIHPQSPRNKLGLTVRDYEGGMSTLCAGCGHDSVTGAIVQVAFELSIPPHRMAKLSGIGCSSKTPAYFAKQSHGFNTVHGRMPSVASGANAANSDLWYIGVSGDGDSLSIGLGQFCHAIRRNVNMLYIIENNGVYGLTKGQFSASADLGSKAKKGAENQQPPIDPCRMAISMGAGFVARSFSGDKEQLLPLIKAGLSHKGFAVIDVISPCVTFNDHEGSTKSYEYTRQHFHPAIQANYVPPSEELKVQYKAGEAMPVILHDGSQIILRKVAGKYDPTDRASIYSYLEQYQQAGEVITGLLYYDDNLKEMHDLSNIVDQPLSMIDHAELCPGDDALQVLQNVWR
ncbi:MAG TPA: 2-oxoacid:ferredoxin oxidoreductase subunit beta [Gammaproteobacteria bacterium]|jgi:2-oxoglutarate ferredoxin oxidoreductase subunit beta|nr:2-oxoglutarate ferredoxin oxidoreductase subunit beta [Chromatiales bacterium]MCP4925775.1 2-oxoacid:ferredoxin oxidoreductase subunit beta [Gammaproteobacteria bacterium]MDP7296010.1 2-oxoacid:ferredoxin oxidoreductase subunit beta [Gammaproteobacteria bacterium]MDP7659834.1 2-oxoacid:ferredoxin oxidoreductase subunit beta [Gammaproteobacteria bacterium]HJP37858.1 2-oxoacid:ferredoxin oxidoreductase subunit beta [Gammaproteobacteria bacterium]